MERIDWNIRLAGILDQAKILETGILARSRIVRLNNVEHSPYVEALGDSPDTH
ncbi:MAG: hypothetical protein OXI01_14180 [Albidovulum sp.]|nr:hypothetical protein [Albidovulum sp.]